MSVFTVDLTNQPGELARLCEAMAGRGINLVLSAAARAEQGSTSHLRPIILARCRLPACWPPGPQAGCGARLRRCGARRCPVNQVACPGELSWLALSGPGPGWPLFSLPAVRLLSPSGVTPGSPPAGRPVQLAVCHRGGHG